MATYYKGLTGQKRAWQFIESRLSEKTIEEALRLYRDNPGGGQAARDASNATSHTEMPLKDMVLVKTMFRLKELGIKLEKPSSGFRAYIIGFEGCDIDFSINDDAPDLWNDAVMAVYIDSEGNISRSKLLRGTTEPGRHYVKNRLNRNGAAFVAIDTIHKEIWMRGTHKNQPNCLIQIGGAVTVYRDANNSHGRSKSDPTETGYFGINLHSTAGGFNSKSIGRWSAGCCVVKNVSQFQKLMKKVYQANQTKFSYILLDRHAMG